MAVLNTQAACDSRYQSNATAGNTPGPVTYGTSPNDQGGQISFPGLPAIVGTIPSTINASSPGPFPGFEQDQFL